MTVPILIVLISTLEIALANILRDVLVLMSTLEIALANIFPGCTRTFGSGGCPSMQQSGLSLSFVLCAFFMLSLLHLESTLLGLKDIFHTSRFPEACVSERRISRIF